jgi:nucleotide-binding universal stress UspA family protein
VDIVLASDFSELTDRAIDATISLARCLGDSVVALHAVEPYNTPTADPDWARERAAVARLEQLTAQLRNQGIDTRLRVARGLADEIIVEVARSLDARLIVMGTHGRRAPVRWLLGSVAERVVANADVPVLVVRDGTDALRSWSRGDRALRLTVALESSKLDAHLAAMAVAIGQAAPCDLTLVHVLGGKSVQTRMAELIERDLRANLAQLDGKGSTAIRILAGGAPVTERLQSYLRERAQDVVMVGVHHGTGLEGLRSGYVARGLLHAGIGAVLCVPLARDRRPPTTVSPFRDILVAVDWSELGMRTIACAYGLLGDRSGRINLCHVQIAPASEDVPADIRQTVERRMTDLLPLGADRPGVETNLLVLPGQSVSDTILAAAVRMGCDVICVGSHGRSTIGRVILGSVALDIAHQSHLPVLLVR